MAFSQKDEEEFERIEKSLKASWGAIRKFIRETSAEDFAMVVISPESKTQYLGGGRAHQKKKPRPEDPIINIIDRWIDLQLAVRAGNYPEAVAIYYYLRRVKGG